MHGEIEAERSALEDQLVDLEGGLGALEQDKETLCTLVGAGGTDDSSSDTSLEPSEAGAYAQTHRGNLNSADRSEQPRRGRTVRRQGPAKANPVHKTRRCRGHPNPRM